MYTALTLVVRSIKRLTIYFAVLVRLKLYLLATELIKSEKTELNNTIATDCYKQLHGTLSRVYPHWKIARARHNERAIVVALI